MKFIEHAPGLAHSYTLGGKGAALAKLQAQEFPVPPFVVVRPSARDGWRPGLELPSEVESELRCALDAFLPDVERFAVRSSALDEDGGAFSFAGQFATYLDVRRADVARTITRVWASAETPAVGRYRAAHGLPVTLGDMAVIVQAMVDAEAAGVAFSADPAAGRRETIVSSTAGLGDRLVDGEVSGDLHVVRCHDGVVELRSLEGETAVLQPAVIREVAALAERVSSQCGGPRDVEWAYAKGCVFLLQARPVTAAAIPRIPPRRELLWDDSNISESYPGINSPLTFSFIRTAYAGVYRSFAEAMGVSASRVEQESSTFRNMLGFHRGRVFYNLLNWYRVVAMLPGYASNRQFLEEMLGVDHALTGPAAGLIERPPRGSWFNRKLAVTRLVIRTLRNFVALRQDARRWQRRVNEALGADGTRASAARLVHLSATELVARYRMLERKLITHWRAPIVNDFFAMVFHGVLRRLAARWCDDADGAIANGVLASAGDMISVAPAAEMAALAHRARRDPEARAALEQGTLPQDPAFRVGLERWLDRFGDRCAEELKLESPTLRDDPSPLLGAIHAQAVRPSAKPDDAAASAFAGAAEKARNSLRRHPLRRMIFAFVHGQARRRLRDRENQRFERTRLFGEVRRIFRAVANRLVESGALDRAEDVFFLETEEVLGFVEGTSTTRSLRGLVAHRRVERSTWTEAPPPRFWTHDIACVESASADGSARADVTDPTRRVGLGLSAGVVRGRVRVVRDPRADAVRPGEILVAERTDPGWILAFASASALVVERGSLLSHVAIVSRELGIPAVTGIPGAVTWLEDGDEVEIDGNAGTVVRLSAGAQVSAKAEANRA